jgi:probable HAF family extracellular repeat protein
MGQVSPVVCAIALACVISAQAGTEPATFQGLGSLSGGGIESCAIAVSADGRVVTGWAATRAGTRAFRWSNGHVAELTGNELTTRVGHGVSSDGGVVVGVGQAGEAPIAFRWHEGRAQSLPVPDGMAGFADAWGVSADGQFVGGHFTLSGRSRALLWSGAGVSLLPDLPSSSPSSAVAAVSGDGSTVVGAGQSHRGQEAVAWRGGSLIRLGVLPGGEWRSEAYAVSHDGKIIVGRSASPFGVEAFQWKDNQMSALGGLSREHEFLSFARGLASDGEVIVGGAIDDRDLSQAVVWDAAHGIRTLQRILTADFGLDLAGWRLETATAVSSDGQTIVGCGRNPQGTPEGWITRLPPHWWRDASTLFQPHERPEAIPRLGRGIDVLAPLLDPHGVAIDGAGNTYVADSGHCAIRIFDSSGKLQRTWGSSESELQFHAPHDLVVSANGSVFVADTGRHRLQVISPEGRLLRSWGGRGIAAGQFNRPQGIAVHGGRVYVADTGNDRVQIFDEQGALLRTLGAFGHGVGELDRPADIAIHADGRIFVADRGNHRICVFSHDGSWLHSWGERGSSDGLFNRPTGVECRGDSVYVVDQGNQRVQVFTSHGALRYVWGRGVLRPHEAGGRISYPARIAIAPDQTRAVVCEPIEDRCQSFSMIEEKGGRAPSAFLDAAPLSGVAGSLHIGGNIMALADDAAGYVWMYQLTDSDPLPMTKLGLPGYGVGQLSDAQGLWFDDTASHLFIADAGNRRLQVFELETRGEEAKPFAANLGRLRKSVELPPGESPMRWRPGPLALGLGGLLAVVDAADESVILLDRGFHLLRRLRGSPVTDGTLKRPIGVAFSLDSERLFVLDTEPPQIIVFDALGEYIRSWGDQGAGPGHFLSPGGITAGRDGFVYVSDQARHRVEKFDENGNFVTQWGRQGVGAGEFFKPRDLAQDARGRVYVNDFGNRRIQVFTSDGQFLRAIGAPLVIHPTWASAKK